MPFPNITKLARLLLALLLAGATTVALAQERPRRAQAPQTEQRQAAPQDGVLRLLPADAVTEHSADVGGNKLAYTATAGTLSLFDQSGERSAAIFYTAYVAKDAGATSRPITFVFNGGPGAASAFLNLGAVGPRIVEFEPNGDGSAARLVDNPDTWLGFTDLVMIDPVGSGWSRAAKPDGGSAFWSVQGDAEALAKTIALYLSKNGRSSSPKYILGESYGGFRAAKVARALQREQGIIVSGIVMVSPMLEGSLLFGGTRFPLGAALHLPSLAATELERKGTFSKEALAAAERFALTEYLTTLAGPPPKGEAARDFYKRVAEVSGLSESVIAKSRGFIRDAYLKNLRAAEGKIVSRYDATFAVTDPYPESRIDARARSAARRDGARLWQRVRRLCARRARLQDRDDLHSPVLGGEQKLGLGRRHSPVDCQRQRRSAGAAGAEPVVPIAGHPRLQRHDDALCGQPLRARSPAQYRRSGARAAAALSRRAHVLYRRAIAQSIRRRRQGVLSGAMTRLRP